MWLIFLVAGGVCPVLAVAAMAVARMRDDELANPLDRRAPNDAVEQLAPRPAPPSVPGRPGEQLSTQRRVTGCEADST